jgi:hypothetical protein
VQANAVRERMADPEALRTMLESAAVPADGVVGQRMMVRLAPVAEGAGEGDEESALPSTVPSSAASGATPYGSTPSGSAAPSRAGGGAGDDGVDVEEVVHTHQTMQARKLRGEDVEVDMRKGRAGAVAMLHSLMSYHHLDMEEERGRAIGQMLQGAGGGAGGAAAPGGGAAPAPAAAGAAAAAPAPPAHVAALLHDATFVRHQRVLKQFVVLMRYHFARRLAQAHVPDAFDDWEEELGDEDAARLQDARARARSAFTAESLQAGLRRLAQQREARALGDGAAPHPGSSERRTSRAGASAARSGSIVSAAGGAGHGVATAGAVGESLVAAFQQRKAQMGKVADLLRTRIGITADRAGQQANRSLISRSRVVMRVLFSRSLRTSFAWNLQRTQPDDIMARLAAEGDGLSRWLTQMSGGRSAAPGTDAPAKALADHLKAGGTRATLAGAPAAPRIGDAASVAVRSRARPADALTSGGAGPREEGGGAGPQARITCWTIIWRVLRMVIAFLLCEPTGRAVRRRLREPTPLFVSFNLFLLREMMDRVELGPQPTVIPSRMARTAAQQAEAAREARREAIAAKVAERAAGQRISSQLEADGVEAPVQTAVTPRECVRCLG